MPQPELKTSTTESLTDALNVVRSKYDNLIQSRVTKTEGRIFVGGWWLDTSQDIVPRSSKFRDDYSNRKLITEGSLTWRRHFSPFGTSEKIAGTEKVAGAIGLLDFKRLHDKILSELTPPEQEKLLIQGSTNPSMANFLHYKLGLHVYKYNHKEQLQNIVRSLRSNHSIAESLQTITKKSHLAWITGPELNELRPLWDENLQGYQDHFNVKNETELALHVYQKAQNIMGEQH